MRLFLIVCVLFLLSGCESHWEGVYYPRGADETNNYWRRSPYFDNKSECVKWCEQQDEEFYSASSSCLCGQDCAPGATGLKDCREVVDVY
ncbi:MAG: hypothetical protein GF375_06520 [Candidatus Omnitrophica bacterium]|nr:hypothetical protein [Candidatus Omnitrophota bacterium]MBD3269628.1 hypothetical protein [Candidatus Omnitrophota bacterium]